MELPQSIIEIYGGADPIMTSNLAGYTGIDPAYALEPVRAQVAETMKLWGVAETLVARNVETVTVADVAPAELVVMRDVLVPLPSMAARLALVAKAFEFVSPDGSLLVAERVFVHKSGREEPDLERIVRSMEVQGVWGAVFKGQICRHYFEDLNLGTTEAEDRILKMSHRVPQPIVQLQG